LILFKEAIKKIKTKILIKFKKKKKICKRWTKS